MRYASRPRQLHSLFRTAAMLALGCTVGGCASDQRLAAFASGGTTLAFESIDGPPPQVFERFVEALNAEAQAKAITIASREGQAGYRVRAYLAAQISRGRTTIAWVFDVYDGNQQRALRLTGEEPAGRPGRDAWSVADAVLLRRIAQNGMTGIAGLVGGSAPADTPPPSAPAARGPAIASAQPAPAAEGRTALAFRSD